MNKLTELYKELIRSLGWTIMADGKIGLTIGEDTTEIVEGGMYWVFPDTQYRPPDEPWLLFHPAVEVGQEAVMDKIRTRMQTLLVTRTLYLILHMVIYATSEINQDRIIGKQAELLRVMEDADGNTATNITRLITEIHRRFSTAKQTELKYSFLTLYLRNGGRIGNNTYSRVVALSSKFYELLLDNKGDALFSNNVALGIKLRKADVNLIRKLMGWIYPMIDQPGPDSHWIAGSKTDHGAGFYTLVEVYARAMTRLEGIAETIGLKEGEGIQQRMKFDLRVRINESIADPTHFTKVPSRMAMEGRVVSNLAPVRKPQEISNRVSSTTPPSQAKRADAATSPKSANKPTYSDWLRSNGGAASSQALTAPNQGGAVGGTRLVVLADGQSVVVDGNGKVLAGLGGQVQAQAPQQQAPIYTGPTPVGEPILDSQDGRHYFKMSDGTWQLAVRHQGNLVPEGMLRTMQGMQYQGGRAGPRANANGGYSGGYGNQQQPQQPYGNPQQPYGNPQQPYSNQQPQAGWGGRMRPGMR
jgi:hypothetical protein